MLSNQEFFILGMIFIAVGCVRLQGEIMAFTVAIAGLILVGIAASQNNSMGIGG